MTKKNNILLAGAVLLALGSVNTASAGTLNLDCTNAGTIAISNDSTIGSIASDGLGTVSAAEVVACLATATLATDLPMLAALAVLVNNDLGGVFSTDLSLNTDLATSGIAAQLRTELLAGQSLSVAPGISRNNLGQALIFPYYTTRGKKKSLINIFNTSNRTIATKIRFHESHNSRDVLDFTIILSPYDKWSGTVSDKADGTTVLTTGDTSCTAPAIPAAGVALNSYAYADSVVGDNGSDQTADRLREGYVEVIAMGEATEDQAAPGTPTGTGTFAGLDSDTATPITTLTVGNVGNTAYYAKHVKNGTVTTPRNCATVSAAFVAGSNGTTAIPLGNTAATGNSGNAAAQAMFRPLKNGFNPLRGALTIISTDSGVGFGTAAVAIENFNNSANLISAQTPPYFHEPSLASRNGLWTTSGLPVIEAILSAKTVINEWAHNTRNGADTDWIIQFPTKAFHVDIPYYKTPVFPATASNSCRDDNVQAARNKYRGNLNCGNIATSVYSDGTTTLAPFENRFGATGSLVSIDTMIIDSEENTDTASGGVVFSPARSGATPAIPYESNVVTFSGASGASVMSSNSPELSLDPVGSTVLTEQSGMARITFPNAGTAGLPVVGFVAKQRNQGDSALSFGQMMKHSMLR